MSGILFLIFFVFYLSGLSGTVPCYRDSGDLIASIHTLGIAHPPGYALYIILGKLFVTIMPWGNVAYRVNVLSAVLAAGTVVVLYKVACLIVRHPGGRQPGSSDVQRHWAPAFAGVTAILFATSPAVVTLARVAEMYTMAAFFAATILLCLLSENPRGVILATFLLGLGLSVHPTLIFLVPLLFVSSARPLTRSSALSFMLGLSVFLYLPIRAAQHPLVNWGDPSSWRNFWRVVTRADYGGLKLHPEQSTFSWTAESVWAQMKFFAGTMKGEWGWGALAIGSLGIVTGFRQKEFRRQTGGWLAAWLLSGPGFFLLSNLPIGNPTTTAILQPYLLLAGLMWAPLVLEGCAFAASWRAPRAAVSIFVAAFLIGTRTWAWTSERNDFFAYDYARNLMRSLPTGAVLFDPDDPTHFSIQVLQMVEHRRPDIVLLNFFRTRWGYEQIKRHSPDLLPPVPIESGQELERLLWSYSSHLRPFYTEVPQKLGAIPYRAQGLVYAAQAGGFPVQEAVSRKRAETLLALYVKRGDFVTIHHSDFFTRHLIGYYAAAECNIGLDYANSGAWVQAVEHYQAAIQIDPELFAAYNNWGIVAFNHQDYAKASDLFSKALVFDPHNESLRNNAQLALQKMRKLI